MQSDRGDGPVGLEKTLMSNVYMYTVQIMYIYMYIYMYFITCYTYKPHFNPVHFQMCQATCTCISDMYITHVHVLVLYMPVLNRVHLPAHIHMYIVHVLVLHIANCVNLQMCN